MNDTNPQAEGPTMADESAEDSGWTLEDHENDVCGPYCRYCKEDAAAFEAKRLRPEEQLEIPGEPITFSMLIKLGLVLAGYSIFFGVLAWLMNGAK